MSLPNPDVPEQPASPENQGTAGTPAERPALREKPVLTEEVDSYVEFVDHNTLPPRAMPAP